MSDSIAELDNALADTGEDVILRRPVGTGVNQRFVSVKVRARVTVLRDDQISAGITQAELNFIISPTQINEKQWPGGTVPQLPPFDIDQRIPRASADQIVRWGKVHTITFVDDVIVRGELVRINGRMTG